jgi:hypothetical protein
MSQTPPSLATKATRSTKDYRKSKKNIAANFSLKNNFLFECLFCKKTFTKIVCYLKHINKHEMKQIHKCTVCKKIIIDDKSFREHFLENHSELLQSSNESEANNNVEPEKNMDNFYQQIPYSYYQQFPQITTPILSNYIIKPEPQAQSNSANINMSTFRQFFYYLLTLVIYFTIIR